MSEPTQHMTEAVTQGYCKFPESSMKASRDELDDLKLKIEGNLPEDIQGHVFIIAPVGSVNSGGLPYPDGDSLLNGDGTTPIRQHSREQSMVDINLAIMASLGFLSRLASVIN
jgi:hypothetical protein